jgi:hypothetical protein
LSIKLTLKFIAMAPLTPKKGSNTKPKKAQDSTSVKKAKLDANKGAEFNNPGTMGAVAPVPDHK